MTVVYCPPFGVVGWRGIDAFGVVAAGIAQGRVQQGGPAQPRADRDVISHFVDR